MTRKTVWHLGAALAGLLASSCATTGSSFMNQPLPNDDEDFAESRAEPPAEVGRGRVRSVEARVLTGELSLPEEGSSETSPERFSGHVLGSFRNTYYDFPSENDFSGDRVSVKDPRCKTIRDVPRGFFEALCVQGSGTLASGATLSFAKRDCACADVCPRTAQKICFDELDSRRFPWGRGATGGPITPLLSVAVDSNVIPLGTPIYIPEYDGKPRDEAQSAFHDGCFIAQDRGLRVTGKHVDVFTGDSAVTKLWNQLVPSNKGVTVVLDSPRCARAADSR